jgi:hypothetical protein
VCLGPFAASSAGFRPNVAADWIIELSNGKDRRTVGVVVTAARVPLRKSRGFASWSSKTIA